MELKSATVFIKTEAITSPRDDTCHVWCLPGPWWQHCSRCRQENAGLQGFLAPGRWNCTSFLSRSPVPWDSRKEAGIQSTTKNKQLIRSGLNIQQHWPICCFYARITPWKVPVLSNMIHNGPKGPRTTKTEDYRTPPNYAHRALFYYYMNAGNRSVCSVGFLIILFPKGSKAD